LTSRKKHIVLVNGIYPPDGGASGEVANGLVGQLLKNGLRVSVVTTSRKYNIKPGSGSVNGKVVKVSSFSFGKIKVFRLFLSLFESLWLIRKAKNLKGDFFIICSDPPLLNWVSTFLLKKNKWILWTMDLYPEAFVANGLIKKEHWVNRSYENRLKKIPPSAIMNIGEGQSKFIMEKYNYHDIPSFVIPCGLKKKNKAKKAKPEWKNNYAKICIAYCGNLGEAHSEGFIIELIRCSHPQKHSFILSLFGSKSEPLKKKAKSFENVNIVDWISEEDLLHIDLQIVTLKNKWEHICVPSKAVSSVYMNTPLIYHGSDKGDIYLKFKEVLWHINDTEGSIEDQIIDFYRLLTKEEIEKKKLMTKRLKRNLDEEWNNSINKLAQYLKDE